MRLTETEVAAIKASAREAFGQHAVVRLFGSRLDDGRRGGDIDLLVQTARDDRTEAAGLFRRLLNDRMGEREYDILVTAPGQVLSSVHRKALSEGVVL